MNKIQKKLEKQTNAYKTATEIIQEQADRYNRIIQPITKNVEIIQKAMLPFSTIDFDGMATALNPILEMTKTWRNSSCLAIIESLNNSFENSNYLSTINILKKNIEVIASAINIMNQNEVNSAVENLNQIDNSIMQYSDVSIAEMSAEINDEKYEEPKFNCKEFDLMLKTISFVNDPIKSAELLSQALIIADHCIDYNFKILIFQKIIEEIAILISGGFITFVVFLISLLLKILLRDTIIYKQYLELKISIKEYKDNK